MTIVAQPHPRQRTSHLFLNTLHTKQCSQGIAAESLLEMAHADPRTAFAAVNAFSTSMSDSDG